MLFSSFSWLGFVQISKYMDFDSTITSVTIIIFFEKMVEIYEGLWHIAVGYTAMILL